MVAFWVPSLWTCSWPRLTGSSSHTRMIDEAASLGGLMKVAIIADSQLMDKTSHDLTPKSIASEISQFYTDLYMRRAFLESVLPLKPHLIIFLGDYFDGGPLLLDEEWQESLSRFKHIFNLNHRGRHTDIPVYYIPGNHDIGYTTQHSYNPKIHGHGLKTRVESAGLKHGSLTSASWDFVKNMSTDDTFSPKVLLTHIPLYRFDWTPCGVHRSSPIINQG